MYRTTTLPLPTPLSKDHQPLRLTSQANRTQPTGKCHYLIGQASSQQCQCQNYQHNRVASGNTCDCGHSSCYHAVNVNTVTNTTEAAVKQMTDQLKRMEENIIREREIRDSILLRERQAWEREVRVLREALAPFYKSEKHMQQKLMELEDRIDGIVDEQTRLKQVVVAVDDAGIALEKRMDQWESSPTKKRKTSHESESNRTISPRSGTGSSNVEQTATPQDQSPSYNKHVNGFKATIPTSPRSSGVLNLVSVPRAHRPLPPPPAATVTPYPSVRRKPSPPPPTQSMQEIRSSGFLALDLVQRLNKTETSINAPKVEGSPEAQENDDLADSPTGLQTPPPGIVPPGPLSLPALLSSNTFVHVHNHDRDSASLKRKHHSGLMALDVLANVSVASPPVR